MPHNSRPPVKRQQAGARLARLRAAGVPRILTATEAWYLSGGIVGTPRRSNPSTFSLSYVALRVPDCEHFLPDYLEAFAA